MPDQKIAEGLGRCDNARTEMVIREYGPVQLQDGCGRAAGQFCQKQAVFIKKFAQDLGNGKDPLPVRNMKGGVLANVQRPYIVTDSDMGDVTHLLH